ncbi:MAG: pseudouridylate synthase [Ponticaulis sp.]|nr:pseudouridylate synthase [Ponticaulis sp.]|tara:strand:+ start:42554 stop:43351 length:798 start_codon:yes stop_codon:yes gene_type:complete
MTPFEKTYAGEEPVRVNKWLAQSGVCSRREAEGLILAGNIYIDGEKVEDAGRKILPGQTLKFSEAGAEALAAKRTVMLNKPVGYVSATPEEGQVPAIRLLTDENRVGKGAHVSANDSLAPVGRLDMDSRGLLILSDDGTVAKGVIGPEADLEKEYIVRVRGRITRQALKLLNHGLELDGYKLKPARVSQMADQTLRFVLTEGRNRQIRRMCDLVELRVIDLVRVRIGALKMGGMAEGTWKELKPDEIQALLRNPSLDELRGKRNQ